MKTLKIVLHYWIALASLAGFLGGWMTLAHAGKPVQSTTTSAEMIQTLPTLTPLDLTGRGAGTDGGGSVFQFLTQSQQQSNYPMLVTKGS